MLSKSMMITLTPMVTAIAGMIAQSSPQFAWITPEMIFSLLAMFGISAGVGAKVKNDKRKQEIELKKVEVEKEKVAIERVEKIGGVTVHDTKVYSKPPKPEHYTMDMTHMRPEEFAKLTELQKDDFVNRGGVVNPFLKETEGIQWNNAGWFDTNLNQYEGKGAFHPYGRKYLWIRCKGAKDGITVRMSKLHDDTGEFKKLLQIDQSGIHDEDNDIETTRLEMFGLDRKTPMKRGKYRMIITAMTRGTSYTQSATTSFEII